jgi:hypothetical protein
MHLGSEPETLNMDPTSASAPSLLTDASPPAESSSTVVAPSKDAPVITKRKYVAPRTATTKSTKPDGPKVSDPFQFGSRFYNPVQPRPPVGNIFLHVSLPIPRILLPEDNPMDFNAWDHVDIDDAYMEYIKEQLEKQRAKPVSDFDKTRFNSEPAKW